MTLALAEDASLSLARNAASDVLVYVLEPNELAAVGAGTVRRIGCSKLFHFEIEIFDELLGQHNATDSEWYWLFAATWWEESRSRSCAGEKIQ